METRDERLRDETLDEEQLRELSTGELVRHALEEARLLARAEVLHAKLELKQEVHNARSAGILLGSAAVLALCGLSVLFVALALFIPWKEPLAVGLVAVVLLAIGGGCAYLGVKAIPRKPLPRTQDRVKRDISLAREQIQ